MLENLGIITCNRPEILYRCLSSYAKNALLHGRQISFYIADDSVKSVDRLRNRKTLNKISKETGLISNYIGLEEKIIFLKRLIQRCDVPPDVIKFALFDITKTKLGAYGANRNSLLMGLAGKKVLYVDDDTICKVALPYNSNLNQSPELIKGTCDPSLIWSYNDIEEAFDSADFQPFDFFGMHNRYLGQQIENRKIRITLNGLVGDCGWGGASKYLFLQNNVLKHLLKTNEEYDRMVCSREMLRSVLTPTLTNRVDDLMTTVFGLDSSDCSAPFFPVGRGEDIIFSQTLKALFPDTGFLSIPGAVQHQPVESRSFRPGEILRSSSGIDLSILLFEVIDFVGINNLSQTDFPAIKEAVAVYVKRILLKLESIIGMNYPSHIIRDAKAYRSILLKQSDSDKFSIPLDVHYGRTKENAVKKTLELIHLFGELIRYWPQLIEASSAMNDEGIPLVKHITG